MRLNKHCPLTGLGPELLAYHLALATVVGKLTPIPMVPQERLSPSVQILPTPALSPGPLPHPLIEELISLMHK